MRLLCLHGRAGNSEVYLPDLIFYPPKLMIKEKNDKNVQIFETQTGKDLRAYQTLRLVNTNVYVPFSCFTLQIGGQV